MSSLQDIFAERIAAGLKRKSITTATRWAETYRKLPKGDWSFKKHPWLFGMHDSESEVNIGQKSAQMGYTETVLNLTFYNIDVKGKDCLYVLPSKTPDASDFSAARFNTALELSDHLTKLFSDVKNVGHKKAGSANLYIRGSQSRSGLKSIPVSFIVLDEVEEFNQDNIPLALERLSGQEEKQAWLISTPTIDNRGINLYYKRSTEEHFFFKCPCCSRSTELVFPDCIEITAEDYSDPNIINSFLKCKECGNKLEHKEKRQWLTLDNTQWVPSHTDRLMRGFYINQLYSPAVKPSEIAELYLRALTNPADEQEFYNSKLGLTHTVEGARVSDNQIDDSIKGHKCTDPPFYGINTMGVDVGKFLHYEIATWLIPQSPKYDDMNMESRCRVLKMGKLSHAQDFDELCEIMRKYGVTYCVIDANPERRKALEFAKKMYGMVSLCFYGRGVSGRTIRVNEDPSEPTITVDRTAWLDVSLGRFRNGTIDIPLDTPLEYKDHLKALVRVYKKDKDGQQIGFYDKAENDADHYAHARNYNEIALLLALNRGQSYTLGKIL